MESVSLARSLIAKEAAEARVLGSTVGRGLERMEMPPSPARVFHSVRFPENQRHPERRRWRKEWQQRRAGAQSCVCGLSRFVLSCSSFSPHTF